MLRYAQYDNSGVDFSLVLLTQNDSSVDFHCGYALQVAWLRFLQKAQNDKMSRHHKQVCL